MKKAFAVLVLSLGFLSSEGMVYLTSDSQQFVKGSDDRISFDLTNEDTSKLTVEVEVQRLSKDGDFVTDEDSFNVLGNGNSFNPGDHLPITLSPSMFVNDTTQFKITFKLKNKAGKLVSTEESYISVVDREEESNNYKISKKKGIFKVSQI